MKFDYQQIEDWVLDHKAIATGIGVVIGLVILGLIL